MIHAFLHTLEAIIISTTTMEVEGTTGIGTSFVEVANLWILY